MGLGGNVKKNSNMFLLAFIVFLPVVVADDCYDLIQNGYETDVDCGGTECWQRCGVGFGCLSFSDCEASECVNNICVITEPRYLDSSGPAQPTNHSIIIADSYTHLTLPTKA